MTTNRILLTAGAAAAALWIGAVPVRAQNAPMPELMNRVDRLQRELSTLERYVYKGGKPPAPATSSAPAQSSAQSSAATSGDEAGADSRTAARNSLRITDLETQIQSLTGRIEELDHRIRQLESRFETFSTDVDQRLTGLEGGKPVASGQGAGDGASANVQMPMPSQQAGQGAQPPQGQGASGRQLGAPPGTLGTIPRDLAVTSPKGPTDQGAANQGGGGQQASAPAGGLPAGTAKQQYDYALSLMLQKQDFATAETALKAFIKQHPKDPLAGNAYYWLGETYYVRKSYQDAAFTFAEGFQKDPKGNKAADSLLKLGMSLDQLGKKREACTAYSRLLENFPKANSRLKARVEREQRRAGCK